MARRAHKAKPAKVTVELLERWQACHDGLEEFKHLFPKGGTVTFRNVLACLKEELDIDWFLCMILTGDQYHVYEVLWDNAALKYRGRRTNLQDEKNRRKLSETWIRKRLGAEDEKWYRCQTTLFMRAWGGKLPTLAELEKEK